MLCVPHLGLSPPEGGTFWHRAVNSGNFLEAFPVGTRRRTADHLNQIFPHTKLFFVFYLASSAALVFPLCIYTLDLVRLHHLPWDWSATLLTGALLAYLFAFIKGLQVCRNIRWDLTLTPEGIHYPALRDQIDTDFIPWNEISCLGQFRDFIGIDLKQGAFRGTVTGNDPRRGDSMLRQQALQCSFRRR